MRAILSLCLALAGCDALICMDQGPCRVGGPPAEWNNWNGAGPPDAGACAKTCVDLGYDLATPASSAHAQCGGTR